MSDNEEREWMAYVRAREDAHLYFDWRWRSVLTSSFGCRSFYLVARTDGRTSGVLPLFFVDSRVMAPALISMPFLNYGGVICDSEGAEAVLLERAIGITKEVGGAYLEMRSFDRGEAPCVSREHKVTMVLPLAGDADTQWRSLDAKVRNQVRKAVKSGLAIGCGGEALLKEFYAVFSRNMRDLGTPVPGRAFFENILARFPDESRIYVARLGRRPVAAAFTLSHKDMMQIPWASSDRRYNRLCPNEFLYWEAIRGAIGRGLARFDFGRCAKGSGTFRFKKQWGPEVVPLYWQYWAEDESRLPAERPSAGQFAAAIALWKRLPLVFTNVAGPIIAKHLTTF